MAIAKKLQLYLVLSDNSYSFMLGCGYYESYSDHLIETGSSDARD